MNAQTPAVHVNSAGPVVIGVPFRKGELAASERLTVVGPDGQPLLWGARTLVSWPDGSTRWALVAFIARQTGRHELVSAPGAVHPKPGEPVRLLRRSDAPGLLTIDNGPLSVALSETGPGPLVRLEALGRAVLSPPKALRLCADDANTAHEAERTLRVLEESPARVRVRAEGGHFESGGRRKLSYRLDVEVWAGLQTLRLDYQFFNLEPGQDSLPVGRIAAEFDLAMDARNASHHFQQDLYGEFYEPREVLNPAPVAIVSDSSRRAPHVEDPAMLLDELSYAQYLDAPLVNTPEWLGVTDGSFSAYLHAQDFGVMQPKRMAADGARLCLEIWPERAGQLSLPQGRSRRQVITLAFAEGRPGASWVEQAIGSPLWEGRACVDREWLALCGEFEQDRILPFGKHGRFEAFLARTMRLNTPADMFDLGDSPDSGYSTSYVSLGLTRQPRRPEAPEMPRVFLANSGVLAPWCDHRPYEPVWTNNEYDAIHAFACELMRTGKPEFWQTLRWMVRHNVEVDFIHYSDHRWLDRISPVHSAGHNTCGGYPSHFWTRGLLEYYCLTGDPDVLEVAVALGDAILRFFHDPDRGRFYRNPDRELGWAALALVHLYDITSEERFRQEIDRLADFFMSCHKTGGGATAGAGPSSPLLRRSLVQRFYFMLNMVEAFDLYERISGRKDLGEWLVRLLGQMRDVICQNMQEGLGAESCAPAMAIAYERTGDRKFLETGMLCIEKLVLDDPRWRDPVPEAKPLAVLYCSVIRFLGHAHQAGLLDAYEYPGLRIPDSRGAPSSLTAGERRHP